jgi:hypothetical protein
MAEQKTKKNELSVDKFLSSVTVLQKQTDCYSILELMRRLTQQEPKMWGSSIIGFGDYHYKYASGHEGDTFILGFSPRKQNIVIYLMSGIMENPSLVKKLGKVKTGKGCLYLDRLEDINVKVLEDLFSKTMKSLLKRKS